MYAQDQVMLYYISIPLYAIAVYHRYVGVCMAREYLAQIVSLMQYMCMVFYVLFRI